MAVPEIIRYCDWQRFGLMDTGNNERLRRCMVDLRDCAFNNDAKVSVTAHHGT